MRIGAISLGCDKNRVDLEKLLARLAMSGHSIVSDEENADILIVNTCAFIKSAKEESIGEIMNAIDFKNRAEGRHVIVTGCLAERYIDELKAELPEVDAFLGVSDYDKIEAAIDSIRRGEKFCSVQGGDAFCSDRMLTTPPHYAYLKIAEGCDNHCTYCAIPAIRGKYRSEKPEDLLEEAKKLSDDGVKELILVAQDVTRYGVDVDGKPHLTELVRELEKLDFEWIRLLYLEPEMVTDELIDFVKNEPKVAKYMDIPFQHVSDGVLKRMNRRTNGEYTRALAAKVRAAGITLRSTFICGFPGESEEDFEALKAFIAEGNIDYAGFFAYSREEGTPADRMSGHLPERVKQKRAKELERLQQQTTAARNMSKIGSVLDVLYEDIDYGRQAFVGRTQSEAPDIDCKVYFVSDTPIRVGEIYRVQITATDGVDMIGKNMGYRAAQ